MTGMINLDGETAILEENGELALYDFDDVEQGPEGGWQPKAGASPSTTFNVGELAGDEATLNPDDVDGDQNGVEIENEGNPKTQPGDLYGSFVDLNASTSDDIRGHTSVTVQDGDGGRNIGGRAYVYSNGPSHNQSIGYYARVVQKSGEDGALPPSAGFYVDSRNSDYRPFGMLVDDNASIWQNGIVLNGDYLSTLIRGPGGVFTVTPDGDIKTEGTVEQSGDVQPRYRKVREETLPDNGDLTIDLKTELPHDSKQWRVNVTSKFNDGAIATERGFEGELRYYAGVDGDSNPVPHVSEVLPMGGWPDTQTASVDSDGVLTFSSSERSPGMVVVTARRLNGNEPT